MLTYFFQEIALQLNSIYHKAIKAIPYEVVYNRKIAPLTVQIIDNNSENPA